MLTCIACSKQQFAAGGPPLHDPPENEDAVDVGVGVGGAATPGTRHAIKALTAQVGSCLLGTREWCSSRISIFLFLVSRRSG